jgi:hypothetical protein
MPDFTEIFFETGCYNAQYRPEGINKLGLQPEEMNVAL